MELRRHKPGDELLRPGELLALRRRVRNIARRHDLASVIACAFDHRTRMLPSIYADMRMAPAKSRAGGALETLDLGIPGKTHRQVDATGSEAVLAIPIPD